MTDPAESEKSDIVREQPEMDPARSALVQQWHDKIAKARSHFEPTFKLMRENMRFLRGKQWEVQGDQYVANIIHRHIQTRVASLYARNPRATVRRRKTLDFAVWDGSPDTMLAAQQSLMVQGQAGMPVDPNTQALVQDFMQGSQRRSAAKRLADTLEIVFKHQIDQQIPPFKVSMKQLVRRTCTVSVGWLKLGFRREMDYSPSDCQKMSDVSQRMASISSKMADLKDGEITEESAQFEQLKQEMEALQSAEKVVTHEGLTFDFPHSQNVIIDPCTTNLRGLINTGWIAHEFLLSADKIKEIYGVDVGSAGGTKYEDAREGVEDNGAGMRAAVQSAIKGEDPATSSANNDKFKVLEVWDREGGLVFTLCDGYKDYLAAPQIPTLTLERFYPFFPLVFNEVEDDCDVYPPSDVELLKPMQLELNRSRQGLREHRHANRPKMAVAHGMLDQTDVDKLSTHPANAVLTLKSLAPGQKVSDLLQPIEGPKISAELYDTDFVESDMQRVIGSQEAAMGPQSNVTATGSSIAESGRVASVSSNIDDLNDFLSEVSRASGQVLLSEMDAERAIEIAGPGATWPTLSPEEIYDELYLEVEAGSSGIPNQTLKLQNFQQLAPILLQVPGINPTWLAKQAIQRMDETLEIEDAIIEGAPAIIAQNQMKRAAPAGDPAEDPNQQGGEGANNTQKPPDSGTGPAKAPGPEQQEGVLA